MPKAFYAGSPEFHYTLSDLLLNPPDKRLNIIAPRGTAKSTLVGILLVIHHIFFGPPGKKVVLICSRTLGHATNLLQTIKNIFEYNPHFKSLFGYWGQQNPKVIRWREEFVNFPEFAIICKGTGQQARGLNIDGQRPTLIIVDDPEDENNTVTEESMEKNFKWLQGAVVPSMHPLHGRIVVIGTPLDEKCIVMSLKNMADWHTVHYSHIYDEKGEPVFVLTKEMEQNPQGLVSIWEEMRDVPTLIRELRSLREQGRASIFHMERLCWVIGDDDQLVREDEIRYWKGSVEVVQRDEAYITITHLNKKELPEPVKLAVVIFGGWDPASSTSASADYSVGFFVAVDAKLRRFCLPMFRGRKRPIEVADTVLQYDQKYQPVRTKIESVAYQEMLKEYVQGKRYIPGLAAQGSETKPRMPKNRRLFSLQGLFAEGKIYMNEDDPNTRNFISEATKYPKVAHDDILDGCYYACMKNYPPTHDYQKKQLGEKKKQVRTLDWQVL